MRKRERMSDGQPRNHVHTTPTRPKPKSNPRAPRSERARAPNSQAPVPSRQSTPAGTCPLHSSVLEFLGPFEEGFDDVAHVRDDLDAVLVGLVLVLLVVDDELTPALVEDALEFIVKDHL